MLKRTSIITGYCLLAIFGSGQNLHADSLSAEIRQAAIKLTEVMVEQGRESCAIASFKDHTHGNFGPGIRAELARAFAEVNAERKKNGKPVVSVSETSNVILDGEFARVDDPNDQSDDPSARQLAIEIKVVLKQGAEELFRHSFFVNRIRDIVKIEGLNFSGNPETDARILHREIRENLKRIDEPNSPNQKPFFHLINETRIKSHAKSQISIEIAAKSALADKQTPAIARKVDPNRKDAPFVPLQIGEIYEVRVYNDSSEEIAVALTIDGLDQFMFSDDKNPETGQPRFTHWIVAPKSRLTIPGWHRTADPKRDDSVLAFLVAKYGEGASKFVPHPDAGSVGVITVAISRSHADPKNAKSTAAETGFGPPIKVEQKEVKRTIDLPHEFISVRYTR
jgi:hypothetical protein